jgi:1-phosphatidylinositol phosphodiesterase
LLNIVFFSAASFPLALPPLIAKGFGWPKWGFGVEGVNERFGKWLVDVLGSEVDKDRDEVPVKGEEKRLQGWAMMDYYGSEESVVPLLVEGNFRGNNMFAEGGLAMG